jgi:cellulose synthase/poly-beta-1,6-N-acetylglucosamine synthase-like glycosyltransferase
MGDAGLRPSISFLSTAYRTEWCISQMIDSVLAQTRTDWELVVVDNGYSDEMARIVSKYSRDDSRIRLVRQENQGVTGGVNAAARHARGRYFAVLNSDDQVLPKFAEKLIERLDVAPDLDAVVPDAFMVLQPSGVPLTDTYSRDKARLRNPRPLSIEDLIAGFIPYYCGLIRREVWDAAGGLRDVNGFPDLQLWFDLTAGGRKIGLVEEPLGVCAIDDQSESRSTARLEALERGREKMIVEAARRSGVSESSELLTQAIRRARNRRAVVRARGRLLEGDTAGARTAVREALCEAWSVRTAAIAGALVVAPQSLRRAYLIRQRLRPAFARLQLRVSSLLPYQARRLESRDVLSDLGRAREVDRDCPDA